MAYSIYTTEVRKADKIQITVKMNVYDYDDKNNAGTLGKRIYRRKDEKLTIDWDLSLDALANHTAAMQIYCLRKSINDAYYVAVKWSTNTYIFHQATQANTVRAGYIPPPPPTPAELHQQAFIESMRPLDAYPPTAKP